MVDKPDMNPSKGVHHSVTGADHSGKASSSGHKKGDWNPPPMTWLGMHFDKDDAKKLWNIICQNINSQISKDKEKAIKALRKMNPDKNQDD